MAKGEAKKTNTAIDQARSQQQQFQTQFGNTMQQRGNTAYASDTGIKDALVTGYGGMANTGGITPEQEARLRGLYTNLNSSGGGGGYVAPSYTLQGNTGDILAKYKELMGGGGVNRYALPTLNNLANKQGGISDENYGNIQSGISGFKGIGQTGGYDPEALKRIQGTINDISQTRTLDPAMMGKFNEGLGGYSEFARTGGVSQQQAADIMRRGTSTIPAMFNAANNQARQQATIQGGYAPGLSAALRNNTRAAGAAGADAALQARLGLQDTINQGRLAGMQGLTSNALPAATAMNDALYRSLTGQAAADQGLQQAIVGNKLQGLTGQVSGAQNLANAVSSNQLGAANAMNNLTNTDLNAVLAGTGGAFGVSQAYANEAAQQAAAQQSANSAGAADAYRNAQFGADIEKYLIDTSNQNKFGGLGGLGNVYTSTPGETGMYYGNQLQNQAMTGGQVQDNLALRAQYNPNVSAWDRAAQMIGAGTSAAGAIMGGLGGFTGRGSQAPQAPGINMNSPVTPSNWYMPNFQNPPNTNPYSNPYRNIFGGGNG